MAFIGIFMTSILIVAFKAASTTNKHKLLRNNFSPSGQAGIAFAANTIIWMSTENIVIISLSLIMAILICITRSQTKQKTVGEIIVGSLSGISIVTLLYGIASLIIKII